MDKKDFIRMTKGAGEPPVCAAPEEAQSVIAGMPFSIDLVASDPGDLITGIECVRLPPWATLNIITELPSPDAIARISGTPGPRNTGFHLMWIVATNSDGNHAVSPLRIKVIDYGFADDQPGVF